MKLFIKEYLSSLRERGELDAILPDLLSQCGLHVFSRPGIGNRQYGVDIAAVGELEGEPKKVYLLSVKSGNLGRRDWNSGREQDLQPSLDEIIGVYIPTHLPSQYKKLPIEICICIGGDIEENVRLNLTSYEKSNRKKNRNFQEWDGDKLAALIERHFLNENFMPEGTRPLLRKSIALLDEPESSFSYYKALMTKLAHHKFKTKKNRLTALRQMNICLWILYSWARESDNLESVYLASEITLLFSWELTKDDLHKRSSVQKNILATFYSILSTYNSVASTYCRKFLPFTQTYHGLSSSVRSSNSHDINIKLFDLLGRFSMAAIWTQWKVFTSQTKDQRTLYQEDLVRLAGFLKSFIVNNPILNLPIMDDQAIDIGLTLLALSSNPDNQNDIINWLNEIFNRALISYQLHGDYPCIYTDYSSLIEHPQKGNDNYREEATAGSILYPLIALWAALLKDEELYKQIQEAKHNLFQHSNFQIWYIGNTSEKHIYRNSKKHGITYSHIPLDKNSVDFVKIVFNECKTTDYYRIYPL